MTSLNLELYRKMYLIRKSEETIQEYYPQDDMKTPMHMSMGEEAIVAGVVGALKSEDQVLGTYRSHALYLAKTGETDLFFAEMYGKATGMAQGKSGSMHLSAPQKGLLCCSAIVARAPNMDGAKKFMEFILSKKAQELAVTLGNYSVRPDVPPPKGAVALKEMKIFEDDYKWGSQFKKELLNEFNAKVAMGKKTM